MSSFEIMADNASRPNRDAIRHSLGIDAQTQARLEGLLPDLQSRLGATSDSSGNLFSLLDFLAQKEHLAPPERAWLILSLLESKTIDMAVFAAAMGISALFGYGPPMPVPQPAAVIAAPDVVEVESRPEKRQVPLVAEPPIAFLVEDDGKPVEQKSIKAKTDDWLEAARRDFVYKVLETQPDDWIEIFDELKKDASSERVSAILTESLISPDDHELPSKMFLGVVPPLALASIWAAAAGNFAPLAGMGAAIVLLRLAISVDEKGAVATAKRLAPFPGLFPDAVREKLREPLYFYVHRNFPASLSQKLLPYIPKIARLTNHEGQNALHAAALDVDTHIEQERHLVIDTFSRLLETRVNIHKKVSARYIEQLLSAGVDPFARDLFGKSSVDYLFANGHVDALRALFNDDNCHDAIWQYKDGAGRNLLHLAVVHNLPGIINLMVGNDERKKDFVGFLDGKDGFGRAPADYLANKFPGVGPIGEITVTAFETAHAKVTRRGIGFRASHK